MTALLIIFPNAQRAPQLLALFDLRLSQLMDLMALEFLRVRASNTATAAARLLRLEFLAQGIALVVDCVFVESVIVCWLSARPGK